MKKYLFLTVVASVSLMVSGQNPTQEDDPDDQEEEVVDSDEDDREVRENPVIDFDDYETEVSIPSFIKLNANKIQYNGANWAQLRKKLENSSEIPVSIVHIGDSHLQADFATSVVRENLQFDYGNAGRGIVAPLKMSGTNEPLDYSFTSTRPWDAVKLMSQSWQRTMGFTGTSITPITSESNFFVSTSERDDYNPFSAMTVFHGGQFFVTRVEDSDGNAIPFVATPSKDYTQIRFDRDLNGVRIYFDSAGDLTLFGVGLSGRRPGVYYHVIGNNGATYDTYNRIAKVGEGISAFDPSLVIISLGTNEAFGRFDKKSFKESMNRLVTNIRTANPEAVLLLVTPMECQRSHYTSVTKYVTGRKKKKRRKTVKVKSYQPNSNIAEVREAILDYAKHNHIAVYDWYTVAGGSGASAKWINDGLFSTDRVHHSMKGYHLQGELLYLALRSAFQETSNR